MQNTQRRRCVTAWQKVVTLLLWVSGIPALAVGTGPRAQPDWPIPVHDDAHYGKLMVDRFEYQSRDTDNAILWDAQAWYGGDINRLWVATEGEINADQSAQGDIDSFDVQYSRRITPFWDIQAGAGYQGNWGAPGPAANRYYAIMGFQGLAPYWFEVASHLHLSEDGDAWLDFETEYDWRLTQRLVLQPRFSTLVSANSAPAYDMGAGLNSAELGLRLRYGIVREFAPYIGISWHRKFAETARWAKARHEAVQNTQYVAGVRWWF